MNILHQWAELYRHRTDWAFAAHKAFLESFQERRVRGMWSGDPAEEVMVAVFGPSQVGKTTLILKLIGVDPKHLPVVSQCLRGYRRPGDSSTATSTIYSRSPDDYFHIRDFTVDGMTRCETEEELTQRVAGIRERMETQQGFSMEPVKVWIPAKYFTAESYAERTHITIIDLPGFHSSSVAEHVHVNKLIRHYMPKASLILLVDQVHQLAHFQHFGFRDLDTWKDVPEKFRIVLTHSVSNHSIQQQFKDGLGPDDLRKYVYREFSATVSGFPSETIQVYPLEYGQSWNSLLSTNSLASTWVETMEKWFQELRQDILHSQDEYSRVRLNRKMFTVIKKIYENEEENLNQERDKIRVALTGIEGQFKQLNEILYGLRGNVSLLQGKLKQLESGFPLSPSYLTPVSKAAIPDKKATHLRKIINQAVENTCFAANQRLLAYEQALQEFLNELPLGMGPTTYIPRLSRIREEELKYLAGVETLLGRLNNRKLDGYYLAIFTGKWDRDFGDTCKLVKHLSEVANQEVDGRIEGEREKCSRVFQSVLLECAEAESLLMLQSNRLNAQRATRLADIHKLNKNIEDFRQRRDRDLSTANNFDRYLRDSFGSTWRLAQGRLNGSRSKVDQLLNLAYLKLLEREYDKLVEA